MDHLRERISNYLRPFVQQAHTSDPAMRAAMLELIEIVDEMRSEAPETPAAKAEAERSAAPNSRVFNKGDRVQLSDVAIQRGVFRRADPGGDRQGTVIAQPTNPRGVSVRWDGRKSLDYITVDFLRVV